MSTDPPSSTRRASGMPVLKRRKHQLRQEWISTQERAIERIVQGASVGFRSHLWSFLKAVYPRSLQQEPGHDQCDALRDFVARIAPGRRDADINRLRQIGQVLEFHPELLAVLEEKAYVEDEVLALENKVCEGVRQGSKHWQFAKALRELRQLSGVRDLALCGDIGLASALDFCLRYTWNPSCCKIRANLLEHTGFRHCTALQAEENNFRQTMVEFPNQRGCTPCQMHRLSWLLKQPAPAWAALPAAQLAAAFTGLGASYEGVTPHHLFTGLRQVLVKYKQADTLAYLLKTLPPAVTGLRQYEWFCNQSSWHHKTAERMVTAMVEHHSRTHNREAAKAHYEQYIVRHLVFLLDYVSRAHATEIAHEEVPNALDWFLQRCTATMAMTACVEHLKTCRTCNAKVKATREKHHAANFGSFLVSLYKNAVAPFQDDSSDLPNLRLESVLRKIPNQRVAAQGDKRRQFTKDEMDALLQTASRLGTRHFLVIKLLREIGLRAACVAGLQYGMLLDDAHMPRHTCRVPEKGRTWRHFVTSPGLKAAIKAHSDMLRKSMDAVLPNMYILSCKDPQVKPSPERIRQTLNQVAELAGVSGSHVHPHAFRHTIVGELVAAGNSMEVASKYMGHARVDTTSQNYWVPTITELHEKLQNPFTGQMQAEQETQDELARKCEMLRTKLDTSIRLLHHQNTVFRTAAADGSTAAEALHLYQSLAPDAEEILRHILESTDGSSMTASSVAQGPRPRTHASCPSAPPISEHSSVESEGDDMIVEEGEEEEQLCGNMTEDEGSVCSFLSDSGA